MDVETYRRAYRRWPPSAACTGRRRRACLLSWTGIPSPASWPASTSSAPAPIVGVSLEPASVLDGAGPAAELVAFGSCYASSRGAVVGDCGGKIGCRLAPDAVIAIRALRSQEAYLRDMGTYCT